MKFSSVDGRDDGKHDGVGLVEIAKIFVEEGEFFGAEPFGPNTKLVLISDI